MAIKQIAYLGLAEPAVSAWRPDATDSSRRRPPRDSLGVDSEERGYFPRCEQSLTVAVHRFPLPWSLRVWGLVSQKLVKLATNTGNRVNTAFSPVIRKNMV